MLDNIIPPLALTGVPFHYLLFHAKPSPTYHLPRPQPASTDEQLFPSRMGYRRGQVYRHAAASPQTAPPADEGRE